MCSCGKTFGRHERMNDRKCRIPCKGDRSQDCGGPLLAVVYNIPPSNGMVRKI